MRGLFHPPRLTLLVLTGLALCARSGVRAEGGEDAAVSREEAARLFAVHVGPLLRKKCFGCHGEDPEKIKGGLDLRTREGLLRGGESEKPAVVPGDPEASLLLRAVTWEERKLRMPPKARERLGAEDIERIRRWILGGAPWIEKESDHSKWTAGRKGIVFTTSGGLTPQWTQRRYDPEAVWAWFPPRKPEVPGGVFSAGDDPHPVDAFILRRLEEAGLEAAPRAPRDLLLRRLHFDLTGLPPEPEDYERFLADRHPLAWEREIDRLLASPRYGERMAQHWLDVVRYADTSGYSNDFERPHAWRYRDYVIRSFNQDKPYDRFIVEQIAGDELEPGNPEMRIAVGFLRMGPWEHTGMSVAAVTRQLWLDDVTNAVGETFLGTPLRCARCHDHKFDPIPTRDYYRVQAVFAATWFDEPETPFLDSENVFGGEERTQTVAHQLAAEGLEPLVELEGDNAFERIHKKLTAYRKLALARFEPKAFSVKNGEPQKVAILLGGSLERPGEEVEPGVLSALADAAGIPSAREGRRLAFARWIASASNPLTARVFANRVWQWHFGRGIAATPNTLGVAGARPTHPELLDWLAVRFVEEGWSIKRLHRLILTSAAYRRASTPPSPETAARIDPGNRLLSYMPPRRLSAEEIRDAMLAASGELSLVMGGPGVFPEIEWEVALMPRHIMGAIAPSYRPSLRPALRNRRTIYVFRYRGLSHPMLEAFDRPNPDLSCERRSETTVVTQALELLHGRFSHARALALAARIAAEESDPGRRVEEAVKAVYGRAAKPREREMLLSHYREMLERHRDLALEPERLPQSVTREMVAEQTGRMFRWREKLGLEGYVRDLEPAGAPPDVRALGEVCLVLFNTSDFLYVY